MPTSPYDTHAGVKRLTEAGMPAPQAEAVINENLQLMAGRLATKDELLEAEARLQTQITALRHEFQLHREEERTREYRMVAEIAGVVATLLGVFAAVMKFL